VIKLSGTTEVFARKASGLVRSVSPTGALLYNLSATTLYLAGIYAPWMLYIAPGADLMSIAVIMGIGLLFGMLTYSQFAASMPRSGGDYVYIGRTFGGELGFISSFVYTSMNITWPALSMWFASVYGLSEGFYALGIATGNQTMLAWGAFFGAGIGPFLVIVIANIVIFAANVLGWRTYFGVTKVALVICFASAIGMLGILASSSHQQFVSVFNTFMAPIANQPNYYDTVIKTASNFGYNAGVPHLSLWATLVGVNVVLSYIGWAMFSTYIGGEVKQARSFKVQLYTQVGCAAIVTAFLVATTYLATQVFGYSFIGASSYLTYEHADALPIFLPQGSIILNTILLAPNLLLGLVITFGFALWNFLYALCEVPFFTRNFAAYSLDRVMPKVFSSVSTKYHTPVFMVTVAFVGALLYGAAISFTGFIDDAFLLYALLIIPATISWTLTGLAGIAFPFRTRTKPVFESSPIRNLKVGGVPFISISGTIWAGLSFIMLYVYLTEPIFGVAGNVFEVGIVAFYVAAILIFLAMRWYRRRTAISLDATFREIPPE
jgi:APA family basic amino acid/polyamine antiporter